MSADSRDRLRAVRRCFRLDGADQVNGDVAEEVQFHLDSRIADLCRQGVSHANAKRIAQNEFGDLHASRKELAAIDYRMVARRTRTEWWAGWRQDLTLAFRNLRKRPGFSAIIVATLALGIGATTTVLSLANATLLRPLPYREADRLVHLWETRIDYPRQESETSYPNLRDWREANHSFVSLDGYNETNLTFTAGNEAARLRGVRVTAGFLSTLGVRLARGRDLSPLDEGAAVAIITDDFWRNQFNARPDVLGQQVTLDGRAHSVIGVLPREFHFAPTQDAVVWLPLQVNARSNEARDLHWLNVVARMRNGVTLASAQQDLTAVMRRLATSYPESNSGRTVALRPLRDVIVGNVQPLVLLLLASAGLLLLIACANVAGLFIARSLVRAQELALRAALGASRIRMALTLLTESLVLALIGGAFGAALSLFGVRGLVATVPEAMQLSMPTLRDAHVDGNALVVSTFITILCGLGAGLLPALTAGRQDLATLLRQAGRNLSGRADTSRTALIVGEIALTMVLLVGTGLLGRSMLKLMDTNFGFDTSQVLTARIALAGDAYAPSVRQQKYFEQLLERLRTIPGVQHVGAVSNPPFNGGGSNQFRVEGEVEPLAGKRPQALLRGVAGDYFETLRIPVKAGRVFAPTDDATRPPVVLINASLATALFGVKSPVGRQIRFYGFDAGVWTVIGVVADVKTAALDQPAPPTVYMTHLQTAENRMTIVLRSTGDPTQLTNSVRSEVRALDPQLPVYAMETITHRIQRLPEVSTRRFALTLIATFSASALLLAIIGIYGLITHVVSQRTREFGIRRALGARRAEVMVIVLRQGVTLALSGIVAGGVAALVLTQFMQTLLFGVPKIDLWTYTSVVLLMLVFALIASLVPAQRAANIDPVVALRAGD